MDVFQLLRLRFVHRRGAQLHFFHGPAIYAFLLDRLGNPPSFPSRCGFLPVEHGRVRYRPGEAYHLGLILLPGAELDVAAWARVLSRPPHGRFARTAGAPFGKETDLTEIYDCVGGHALPRDSQPRFLTLSDLDPAVRALTGQSVLQIRFESPLLILRTPVSRKDTIFDGDSFDPAKFLERIAQSVGSAFPPLFPASAPPVARVLQNRLLRADAPYPSKTLLGSRGSVVLELSEGLDAAWARALLIASALGVGVATNMGQGRFSIEGFSLAPHWPPPPALSLCERAADPQTLAAAREAIGKGGETAGVDGVSRNAFLEQLTWKLDSLREKLALGTAGASVLRGIVLEKTNGSLRGLAVPTFEDRFLQRACFEELYPAVDQLLEDSSYAYRPGLSRRNAELSVRRAHDEGYRHVLDADLRAFFDLVDWELLEAHLRAYFGRESIVDLLMRWVRAPVEFADQRIERTSGLPQGAVISPLLANLYLDSFDEAMSRRGFRVVRYADDFVVLCRSGEDVQRARDAVQEELTKLRLELSPEKTSATSFEHGFRFLGFLFCRSLVLDAPAATARFMRPGEDLDWADATQLLPSNATGWIAEALSAAAQADGAEPETRWHSPVVSASATRRPVYVVDGALRVTATRRGLRLFEGESPRAEIAWERVSEVAVLGGRPISPSVFQHAMRHRVPVALYARSGEPIGLVLPDRVRTPSPSTYAHWRWHDDPERRLAVARGLVEAKIHNLRLLAKYQGGDNEPLRDYLGHRAAASLRAESLERLRGIEGQAAHAWFGRWHNWVAPRFSFDGRTARGAKDPVNALLNLLYTQLFRLCWMGCLVEGLDPYLGVLHDGRGRYAALAADLQEPFRFLCDRLAIDLIHRGQIGPEDFVSAEKQIPPVRLKLDALRSVLLAWEGRLQARVRFRDETRSYRQHVREQARRFAQIVEGKRADLRPFRLKW